MKRKHRNQKERRYGRERRKVSRNVVDRRQVDEIIDEVEFVEINNPNKITVKKRVVPEDFEESEGEKMIAEHPMERIMLTIVQEIDYASEIRNSETCLAR